jgi:hypothetical protein
MGINGWMKKFLRAKDADVANDTSFSPTGIESSDLPKDPGPGEHSLHSIQCVNSNTSLAAISNTLSGLNKLIMPSCYNFRKFATGIWDYIYDTYRNNRPNRMGSCSKIR